MRIDHAFSALETVVSIRVLRLTRLLAENSIDQIAQMTAISDFAVFDDRFLYQICSLHV
jgi:hypothetical protein